MKRQRKREDESGAMLAGDGDLFPDLLGVSERLRAVKCTKKRPRAAAFLPRRALRALLESREETRTRDVRAGTSMNQDPRRERERDGEAESTGSYRSRTLSRKLIYVSREHHVSLRERN